MPLIDPRILEAMMAQPDVGLLSNVADKTNPLAQDINPMNGISEGGGRGMGARGGVGGTPAPKIASASDWFGEVVEHGGRRYAVKEWQGMDGKPNYNVYSEVGTKGGGTTWRTMEGMNRAGRRYSSEFQNVVAKYIATKKLKE